LIAPCNLSLSRSLYVCPHGQQSDSGERAASNDTSVTSRPTARLGLQKNKANARESGREMEREGEEGEGEDEAERGAEDSFHRENCFIYW